MIMKKFFTIQQNHIPLLGLLITFLFLCSCGGGGASRQVQVEKLKEAKASVSNDINNMMDSLSERLDFLDEQIEETEGEIEEQLHVYRLELTAQQELLQEQLDNVSAADLDTWENVINQVRTSVYEARKKMNEVSLAVRELLEEE
jgi:TolA-binding protein